MEKPVVLAQFSIIQSYCGIRNKLQLINMLLHHFILFLLSVWGETPLKNQLFFPKVHQHKQSLNFSSADYIILCTSDGNFKKWRGQVKLWSL